MPGETFVAVRLFHEVPAKPIRQATIQALALEDGAVLASADVDPWGVALLSVPHGQYRIAVDPSTLAEDIEWTASADPSAEGQGSALVELDGSVPHVYVDLLVGEAPVIAEAEWDEEEESIQGMLIGPTD